MRADELIGVPDLIPQAPRHGTESCAHRRDLSGCGERAGTADRGAKEEACFLLNAERFWISLVRGLRHSRGGRSRELCPVAGRGFRSPLWVDSGPSSRPPPTARLRRFRTFARRWRTWRVRSLAAIRHADRQSEREHVVARADRGMMHHGGRSPTRCANVPYA
jgi:hypothetical protein